MQNCDWFEYRWQKGLSRYYKVFVYRDLLGDWMITKVWGGMNSRLGNFERIHCPTLESASLIVDEIKEHRKKRGYELTDNRND